jgi:HSP20 family molecular chaperone IbpA
MGFLSKSLRLKIADFPFLAKVLYLKEGKVFPLTVAHRGPVTCRKEVVMNKDNKFPFMDLNKFLDEVFGHVESWNEKFHTEMERGWGIGKGVAEGLDFYPTYSYPPMNVYLTSDKSLVLEMALAGFNQEDLELQFAGDYLVFSARTQVIDEPEDVRYLKRRLRIKPVEQQKYFVPADKFDQSQVAATFKNGLLRVVVSARIDVAPKPGVKIEIKG